MKRGGVGSAVLSLGTIQRSFWGVGSICACSLGILFPLSMPLGWFSVAAIDRLFPSRRKQTVDSSNRDRYQSALVTYESVMIIHSERTHKTVIYWNRRRQ